MKISCIQYILYGHQEENRNHISIVWRHQGLDKSRHGKKYGTEKQGAALRDNAKGQFQEIDQRATSRDESKGECGTEG